MLKKWNGQSVLVLGLGETGLSLARYLHTQGARLRVADSRSKPPGADALRRELPQADLHCGGFDRSLLQGVDRIAISPGVALTEPLVQHAITLGIPVEGDVELFARELAASQPRPKVIAITGANGKTTVTSMVGAMCAAAGLDVQMAGNISPAVLDAWRERAHSQPQAWVLELSSFQLETIWSLDADAAVVLNVSEDHLDRHAGMDEYAAAKARVFQGSGVQVLTRDDARSMMMGMAGRAQVSFGLDRPGSANDWGIVPEDAAAARQGEAGRHGKDHLQSAHAPNEPNSFTGGGVVWLMQGAQKIMRSDELQVSGLHNVANALAALALCRAIDLPLPPLVQALRAFKGLPHRMQRVAELAGVTYYDDSKGTNVGATTAALCGLGRPAVVILGGEGKGQDFSPLQEAVTQHARAAVLIGRDAPLIAHALADCGKPLVHARDMEEAVWMATEQAQAGDAVLLSPACASFDMFRNYEHRADEFVRAVHKLLEVTA